ncbi:MAG: phage baseplate assembly protein V [Bacteroidales bacterium]|nr:phage baseplate assembly protein V [Bacteroidales bacterium]
MRSATGFRLVDLSLKINDKSIEDIGSGLDCTYFHLRKKMLQPNSFVFFLQNNLGDYMLTKSNDDISFSLRQELLGKKVHCAISTAYTDENGEEITDENPDFFVGFITKVQFQHIGNTAWRIICTAFSPDCVMKDHPGCEVYEFYPLDELIKDRLAKFKDADGNPLLDAVVKTRETASHASGYNVRYNESTYDFIVRMAKRYGEFFYSEGGKVIFGQMPDEGDPIRLYNQAGIESYCYDLQLAQHKGVLLSDMSFATGWTSMEIVGETDEAQCAQAKTESIHAMADSTYEVSADFFGKGSVVISDTESADVNLPENQEDDRTPNVATTVKHNCLKAGMMLCSGETKCGKLRLGSTIVIVDETTTGENVDHEPLRIIDLDYEWGARDERIRRNADVVRCRFKAMAAKSTYPPYPARDANGVPMYGDMDTYPRSQPQIGVVTDNVDPEKLGRVRVRLLWQEVGDKQFGPVANTEWNTPFIHVLQPYVGMDSTGCYFIPEIGDLVMVGFYHGNAEAPFVMGSVRNSAAQNPPETWVEDKGTYNENAEGWDEYEGGTNKNNECKAIRTRQGHTVEIHDTEKGGYIKIYDNNTKNYSITLSTDDQVIRIESKGNIEMKADKDIVLNAGNAIQFKSEQSISEDTMEFYQDFANVNSRIHQKVDIRVQDDFFVGTGPMNEDGSSSGEASHIHLVRDKAVLQVSPSGYDGNSEPPGALLLGRLPNNEKGVYLVSNKYAAISAKEKCGMATDGDLILKGKKTYTLETESTGKGSIEGGMGLDINSKLTKIN